MDWFWEFSGIPFLSFPKQPKKQGKDASLAEAGIFTQVHTSRALRSLQEDALNNWIELEALNNWIELEEG